LPDTFGGLAVSFLPFWSVLPSLPFAMSRR
jgi:hypothetical protein